MLRRRQQCAATAATACGADALQQPRRALHLPGWNTMISTRDARTRAQREAERVVRQVEKLPRPLALHDFDYPYEKTVLSDYMFQYPVYANELDTPHLFQMTPPPGFFVYWSVAQFARTAYPPVPSCDHRLLVPTRPSFTATVTPRARDNNGNKSDVDDEEHAVVTWATHRTRMLKYLHKHEVCPNYIPSVTCDVNMSVVFAAAAAAHARDGRGTTSATAAAHNVNEAAEQHTHSSSNSSNNSSSNNSNSQAVSTLDRDSFWRTAHCGNYIELRDLQTPPALFLLEGEASADSSDEVTAHLQPQQQQQQQHYYTLLIFSPDYPCRVPSYDDRARDDRGFLLTYMVANLRSVTPRYTVTRPGNSSSSNDEDKSSDDTSSDEEEAHMAVASDVRPATGDVVVPYIPPLPTEDAGAARYICVLYRQASHVLLAAATATTTASGDPLQCMSLAARSRFRLHDRARARRGDADATSTASGGSHDAAMAMSSSCLAALRLVEASLLPAASAVTFLHTTWDIQVQEFYEQHGLPEPAAPVDEQTEALLEFHARPSSSLRVRARHRPDGSTNMGGDLNFAMQSSPTRINDGSMQKLWSRRTTMGTNGVPVIYPQPPDIHTPTLPPPP